ncbi:MAG: RNA polymerase sigma factor (sigma-70 family) [Cyclobacteriaceae bacterium]|jgi:RNA polymerase sigma-70 factor (ECF subfamily)
MEKFQGHQDRSQLNWEALKNGDTGAFSALYNSYAKFLLSYGRKIHNNRQVVADSVQELFTYLWNRRQYLGDAPSVKFYLIKALRTIIIKEINKNKTVELSLSEDKMETYNSREHQMITEELDFERTNTIKRALMNLSKREQEILYLKYFAGSSNEEIAKLLNIKYQSVKNVAVSAIKKLKEQFGAANASMFVLLNLISIL